MNTGNQSISQKVKCDICKKEYRARGIKSHMRLFHKLKVTEVFNTITQKKFTPISSDDLSDDLSHGVQFNVRIG